MHISMRISKHKMNRDSFMRIFYFRVRLTVFIPEMEDFLFSFFLPANLLVILSALMTSDCKNPQKQVSEEPCAFDMYSPHPYV